MRPTNIFEFLPDVTKLITRSGNTLTQATWAAELDPVASTSYSTPLYISHNSFKSHLGTFSGPPFTFSKAEKAFCFPHLLTYPLS